MSAVAIHLACLALVGVDFVVRTLRTQLFLHGVGYGLSFREVLVQKRYRRDGVVAHPPASWR
jgi:hypothetical protein